MTAADRKVVDVNNEHILSMLRKKMLAREEKKSEGKVFYSLDIGKARQGKASKQAGT